MNEENTPPGDYCGEASGSLYRMSKFCQAILPHESFVQGIGGHTFE